MSLRRILYFGSFVAPEAIGRFPQVSAGSNMTQQSLLSGLLDSGAEWIVALTQLAVQAQRLGRGVVVPSQQWRPAARLTVVAPSFVNWFPVKPFAAHVQLLRAGMRASNPSRPDLVFCYNPVPGYASAGKAVARRISRPFVMLVADYSPPPTQPTPWRAWQAAWSGQIVGGSDGLVVHSRHVARDLGFAGPWLKVDGVVADDWADIAPIRSRPKTIVYSGAFSEMAGIRLLLDAFERVRDSEARLLITGRGPLANELRAAAARDPRVVVLGFLERREMQRLLMGATVLVNPRPSGFPDNRYNFPGKLLDYLAAGRPVISTFTGDMDEEYRSVTIPLDLETPEALAALIEETCARPDRDLADLGAHARGFVLATRAARVQSERVFRFLDSFV